MIATMTETRSGLNLELSDDESMLQGLARDFARKEIIPRAEHYDQSGEWPWEIFNKAREIGLVNSEHSRGIWRRWRQRTGRVHRRGRNGLRLLRHPDRAHAEPAWPCCPS